MEIRAIEGGIIFKIRVIPRASRDELVLENETLKLRITTPPVDGKANKHLIDFISKLLKIKKSSISIVSGVGSRIKSLKIDGITEEEFRERITRILERS